MVKRKSSLPKPKMRSKKSKGKKINLPFILVAIVVALYYYFALYSESKPIDYKVDNRIEQLEKKKIPYIKDVELPEIKDSTYFVRNKIGRYSYNYSVKHTQSKWVAYILSSEDVKRDSTSRSKKFCPDPLVLAKGWRSASTKDYYQSSFDRGHYVPSSDRKGSKKENEATFLLSNITPQVGRLNSGAWLMLEKKVKEMALRYGEVYVAMGGVFDKNNDRFIGENRVAVPTHCYKVILAWAGEKKGWQSIGFLMPNNENVRDNYKEYAVSVDKIEKLVGVNFFSNIPDSTQKRIEKQCDIMQFIR